MADKADGRSVFEVPVDRDKGDDPMVLVPYVLSLENRGDKKKRNAFRGESSSPGFYDLSVVFSDEKVRSYCVHVIPPIKTVPISRY